MILVDTNVWIDAFRGKDVKDPLSEMLLNRQVLIHPWILGEMSIGQMGSQRKKILNDLSLLPQSEVSPMEDLLSFIESRRLFGKGLSLIDAELLNTCLRESHVLWTQDRTLRQFAESFGKNYSKNLI